MSFQIYLWLSSVEHKDILRNVSFFVHNASKFSPKLFGYQYSSKEYVFK